MNWYKSLTKEYTQRKNIQKKKKKERKKESKRIESLCRKKKFI